MLTNLPNYLTSALFPGLTGLKEQGPTDKIATTVAVGAPQVVPDGSPLSGQVAIAKGAPVVPFVNFIIDTTAFAETDDVTAYLGNDRASRSGCNNCPTSVNRALVYIKSPTCDQYEDFLNELCSTPYTFAAARLTVKPGAGASSNPVLTLPTEIRGSHLNLNGQGPVYTLFPAMYENLEAFQRSNVCYSTFSLMGEETRFGRETLWVMPNLVGKRIYELTLYTASRKEN